MLAQVSNKLTINCQVSETEKELKTQDMAEAFDPVVANEWMQNSVCFRKRQKWKD